MKGVRSLREMTRLLDTDARLRKLCLIKDKEPGYPRSVLSRFSRKVGEDKLNRIIDEKVVKLLKSNKAREIDVVLDASFIKAWSTRHPTDNQTGYSDADARVGRAGRTFALGYKLHLSVDSKTMLPLTSVFASANQNEKKHSLNLLEKTKKVLSRSGAKLRSVIADSQYSDTKIRIAAGKTVIPYPTNQKRDVKGLLRVDKKFRTYSPTSQRKEYNKRPHIEAVNSFLKTQYSMAMNKVRGLSSIATYALYSILCLVLNREAAENIRRPDKAVSNILQHIIKGQGSAEALPSEWLASVQADLKACVFEGFSIVFKHNFEVDLRAVMPGDGEASARLRCANIVASLTMKGLALYRLKDKDSYDIYSVAGFYGKGPKQATEGFMAALKEKGLEKTTVDAVAELKDGPFDEKNIACACIHYVFPSEEWSCMRNPLVAPTMIVYRSASSNETAHTSEKAASRKEYITIGALPPREKMRKKVRKQHF